MSNFVGTLYDTLIHFLSSENGSTMRTPVADKIERPARGRISMDSTNLWFHLFLAPDAVQVHYEVPSTAAVPIAEAA